MLQDILKSISTESQVIAWAKINGYDAGGLEILLEQWNALQNTHQGADSNTDIDES